MSKAHRIDDVAESDIAIVGMAAHLPGAASIDVFWENLREGRSAIRKLTEEELRAAGEAPHLIGRKDYVPYAATLTDFDHFDAEFFGFSPKEAAIMDPQHRQFLQTAWEAMENAAHVPEGFDGPIGVFAGCGMGSYFYFNVCSNRDLVDQTGMFLLRHTGNDKDFLSTRLSHIFDLQGPSINVQTACSTSLVATHQACQSILNGECDMALAGGVTIELPHARGYVFKEGEILSPDGQCHAFDHRAQGTVFGSGVGVVVLRRLTDAIADGDHIWAVIKGTSVNNDGSAKAGYLAPSVDGQAAAIAEAHAVAGVSAQTIDYVECHGTGTYLGDPIEVSALTEAFRQTTEAEDFCRIGSVKTNIGHLDTAAGVASLIKASLALHHRQMPPSLGYEKPNPAIGFEGSPFRVNDTLTDWPARDHPPRAGVNSLGVGGTNAHAVLQAAPPRTPSDESDWPFQLLTVSGRTKAALDQNTAALAAHLTDHPEQPLADVAWTLKEGRRAFEKRRVVVAESHEDAAAKLTAADPRRVFTHTVVGDDPKPVFMFPGGGAQYAGMARDLYETEPVFREWMDRGLAVLQPKLSYDIRSVWLPNDIDHAAADDKLTTPSVQLPLIMITEYALAQLWMAWGVRPDALIGHSMGENTAACLAGVMTFEDCIDLVHLRGQLFDTIAPGGMLSVALSSEALVPYLGDSLDLAAINAPTLSVATGPQADLDALEQTLQAADIECQRIPIDIAAHSRMLDPILERFGDYLRSITLSPPQLPVISNRTGQVLSDAEAMDPEYWVAHLRGTVDFEGGLTTLASETNRLYIEVGPGKALASLAGQHDSLTPNQVISSLRHAKDEIADDAYFMAMLGRVWAMGGTFDWDQVWAGARRNRLPLPTYAFQRSPYFIEAKAAVADETSDWLMRQDDRDAWTYKTAWTPTYAACDVDIAGDLSGLPKQTWLMFEDQAGLVTSMADRLRTAGQRVVTVELGDTYARLDASRVVIAPEHGRDGFVTLIRDLAASGDLPDAIVHGWLLTRDEAHRPGSSFFHRTQEQGFWTLFYLAQALAAEGDERDVQLSVLTSDAMQVRDEVLPYPEKSTVLGPVQVIPREFPNIKSRLLDVALSGRKSIKDLQDVLLEEVLSDPASTIAAYRAGKRYEKGVRRAPLEQGEMTLPKGSAVLVTGGFGGIGLTVSEALIERFGARIVLLSRQPLPDRAVWEEELSKLAPQDTTAKRIRAVQHLERLGADVLVCAADVSNIEDMRAAKAEAEAVFGPIRAVVHAAGVMDDALIAVKQPMAIEDVFTPKIHGTQVLDQVFPDGTIDWIALFSSTSTVTAPAGQIDYVAANEYLNAFAKARRGGKTKVVAINWGLWADVGMAADAMGARTGAEPAPVAPLDMPMLDAGTFDSAGSRQFIAEYTASGRWFLDEHRTRAGDALLPGTGYIELIAEALAAQGEASAYEIRDLTFLSPFAVTDDPRQMRLILPRTDGGYDVRVESVDGAAEPQLHAQAEVSLLPLEPAAWLDLETIRPRLSEPQTALAGQTLTTPQETHLKFGPRWRVITEMALGKNEGLARLRLPMAARNDNAILHPGLMDLATGWAMKLIHGYRPTHLWVPVSYDSIRVHAPLPDEVISWVRSASDNDAETPVAVFDVTIAAPDGTVSLEIEGFSIRRLDGAISFAAPKPGVVVSTEPRPLSPAEERLRHNLTQGIPQADGAEAFMRAMAGPSGQVFVSSLHLPDMIAQAGAAAADQDIQTFERPNLDSEFVAPANDIERKLAGFWEDLLGVSDIGVEDSFFDLGGHSLIAVRLFAKVKKAYSVDFPISVLFEAPTIRKCAALIAQQGVPTEAGKGAEISTPKPARKRFTHLVPMHEGEGGPKTPFFLVAGMFGNVLNLRHLAHLLGTDRPFFGLQAKGLLGGAEPHRDLTEAARDMISEIRQVQPRGPYMVGGFSGGGITAYEIAHQLRAMGQDVSALIMLDTPLPQRRPLTKPDRAAIQRLQMREQGLKYPLNWIKNRIAWEIEKRRGPQQTDDAAPQFHDAEIEAAFYDAISRYEVAAWDGPLSLFRPPLRGKWEVAPGRWVNDERAYVLPDNDWTVHAPNIEVFEVPGDHDSMVLEPNVRVLAARMKKVIQAAERNNRVRPAGAWANDKAAE